MLAIIICEMKTFMLTSERVIKIPFLFEHSSQTKGDDHEDSHCFVFSLVHCSLFTCHLHIFLTTLLTTRPTITQTSYATN